MADGQPSSTAYHEAGHAVVGLVLGVSVAYITVRPTASHDGHCQFAGPIHQCEANVLISLAGELAARRIYPDIPERGCACASGQLRCEWPCDLWAVRVLLIADLWSSRHKRPTEADFQTELSVWRGKTGALVDEHWEWIRRVADRLHAIVGLTGDEIRALKPTRTTPRESTGA